jgi:FAD/FMN-containing dehydrogenase
MSPWAARQMYLNFAETARDPASFWTPQAYDRLRRIKAEVDPDNLIRSNHPVLPDRAR